ncbi:MAG TPA: TRAP transporter large permease [Noviherbaspirillum sp.]|jgi:tripartite ATP-independent transporter DctM subunit|uniref:TRAP transporter large permease n=1 Tax=Noviherbaspirillum sp. TaxID=1926288 RepID=UPI002F9416E7
MGIALLFGFLIMMAIGMPIAFVMGGAGMLALVADGNLSLLSVPQRFFNGINSFPLMAVPFFILAADLMSASAITSAILRFTNNLVGHIRGGLGHVNVLTNMIFAGISGSALADAAGPGAIMMRMMQRVGYDPHYSAALSAATATIGPIIPPSIIMVIYAISDSRVTVAGLFMAGILPGILLAVALAVTNYIISVKRGYRFAHEKVSWAERGRSFVKALPALLMPVIIIGGILGGAFTSTEAAAVAVVYALFVGLFITRVLNASLIAKVLLQSALVTSAALLIVAMASLFAWILTILQLPQDIARGIADVTTNPLLVLFIVAIFVLICGFFIDTLPAVIILVPVLAPLTDQFGIDPLHFAMAIVLNLTIGLITPPVGGVLFVIASVSRLKFEGIARAILPFVLAELVVLLLVILFPQISLAVPAWFGFTR